MIWHNCVHVKTAATDLCRGVERTTRCDVGAVPQALFEPYYYWVHGMFFYSLLVIQWICEPLQGLVISRADIFKRGWLASNECDKWRDETVSQFCLPQVFSVLCTWALALF